MLDNCKSTIISCKISSNFDEKNSQIITYSSQIPSMYDELQTIINSENPTILFNKVCKEQHLAYFIVNYIVEHHHILAKCISSLDANGLTPFLNHLSDDKINTLIERTSNAHTHHGLCVYRDRKILAMHLCGEDMEMVKSMLNNMAGKDLTNIM